IPTCTVTLLSRAIGATDVRVPVTVRDHPRILTTSTALAIRFTTFSTVYVRFSTNTPIAPRNATRGSLMFTSYRYVPFPHTTTLPYVALTFTHIPTPTAVPFTPTTSSGP